MHQDVAASTDSSQSVPEQAAAATAVVHLDTLQPKFLPPFWSADSRVRNSSAPGCGGQDTQQED